MYNVIEISYVGALNVRLFWFVQQGAMVRRTVKAELLYRQQVKAEQHASTSQHFTGPGQPIPGVQPKQEPSEHSRQTKENHRRMEGGHYPRNGAIPGLSQIRSSNNHYVPGLHTASHLLPSHGAREMKQEAGTTSRPSVIQHGSKAGGKPVLNPAPAPRSHLQPTVYGPPHLMVPVSAPHPSASSPSSSKRPYPFTNSHTASRQGAATSEANPSGKDLNPYYNSVKRTHSEHQGSDKNHYTAKIKHYANASSPIVIEDNDNEQPLDFSMKTMRKRETNTKPVNHSQATLSSVVSPSDDGPVNLTVRSRPSEKERCSGVSQSLPHRYSPYHRPHSRPESHSSALGRPPSHETRPSSSGSSRDAQAKSPSQSQVGAIKVMETKF